MTLPTLWFFCTRFSTTLSHDFDYSFVSNILQAMYSEFSTSNIQIDKDFTAKLSEYGCVGFNTEEIPKASAVWSVMSV
jgi:hypothetical protein